MQGRTNIVVIRDAHVGSADDAVLRIDDNW